LLFGRKEGLIIPRDGLEGYDGNSVAVVIFGQTGHHIHYESLCEAEEMLQLGTVRGVDNAETLRLKTNLLVHLYKKKCV